MTNNIFKKCFSEFLGTGLIVFFGLGAIASNKLTHMHLNHWNISLIWGMGVIVAIYCSSSMAEAHLNPAITIFLWLSSQFNKKKVIPYICSQILGSFFFTMLIYIFYYHFIIIFENTHGLIRGTYDSLEVAAIFCAYPRGQTSFFYDLIVEIIISAIFMIVLMAFNDKKKRANIDSIAPFLTGCLVALINLSIGSSNNIVINPARDFGPRLFLSFMGWGILSFTGRTNIPFFLISIIGPVIGTSIGGWIYILLIKNIHK